MIKECSTVVVATCLAFAATGSAHAQLFGLQNLLSRASSAAASAPSLDTTTVKMSGDQMLGELRQLRSGFAADLVVFDEAEIRPAMPTVETDLPGGARRLVQKAEGIAATVVNGQVAFENGIATGNHGGQLLKGTGARD